MKRKKERAKEVSRGHPGKSRKKAAAVMAGTLLVSLLLMAGIWYSEGSERIEQLTRPNHSAQQVAYTLTVVRENGEQSEISVTPGVRRYTAAEAEAVFEEAMSVLPDRIKGKNTSLSEVRTDLELPESLEDLGVLLSWKSENRDCIDSTGRILSDGLTEEAQEVTFSVVMSFQQYSREEKIRVILPAREDPTWEERLQQEIQALDSKTANEEALRLPEVFEGENISFVQKEDISRKMGLAMLPMMLGLMMAAGKTQREDKARKQRQAEIAADYPELIVKMTVLYQAGMSMRSVWERIAADEKKKQEKLRPIYEEVCFACNSMSDGVPETEAYRQFGRRCCTSSCLKLGNLLAGNVRRGTKQLVVLMAEESAKAWEERKHQARRSGEKAGTKMLIPMFMMFGVILVMVVVPAFYGFML